MGFTSISREDMSGKFTSENFQDVGKERELWFFALVISIQNYAKSANGFPDSNSFTIISLRPTLINLNLAVTRIQRILVVFFLLFRLVFDQLSMFISLN